MRVNTLPLVFKRCYVNVPPFYTLWIYTVNVYIIFLYSKKFSNAVLREKAGKDNEFYSGRGWLRSEELSLFFSLTENVISWRLLIQGDIVVYIYLFFSFPFPIFVSPLSFQATHTLSQPCHFIVAGALGYGAGWMVDGGGGRSRLFGGRGLTLKKSEACVTSAESSSGLVRM